MSISTEISSRFWNQPQKADEEAARESIFIDDIIQKAHIEKEILRNLSGIHTVFDGGAGSGRFSILLASKGIKVTHFDISIPMIEKAKEFAKVKGVIGNITFIHGSLEDLSAFHDRQFDMVISFDAPISYTYPHHKDVIGNLVRIADKRIIISVASNLGWIPYLFNPAQKAQYVLDKESSDPFVRWTLDKAVQQLAGFVPDLVQVRKVFDIHMMGDIDELTENHLEGKTQWPVTYAFMPDELQEILEHFGAKNVRLSGPGALSRSIPNDVLVNIMKNDKLKQEFLDFCYLYDSQPSCAGMGKDNLIACADVND